MTAPSDFRRDSGESPVDFLARFTSSERFESTFKEGMSLVEETANYLDGPGRRDAKALDRQGAIAYATESMRLTTRLMQLASWLLLQRAVSAGELAHDDARKEKHRISLADIGAGHALSGSDQLPAALKDIIARSLRLHARILKLDKMLNRGSLPEAAGSAVTRQFDRLAEALKIARG